MVDDDGVVVVVVDRRERTGRVGVVVVVVVVGDDGGGCTSLFACMIVQRDWFLFCCFCWCWGGELLCRFSRHTLVVLDGSGVIQCLRIESTCGSVVLFPVSSPSPNSHDDIIIPFSRIQSDSHGTLGERLEDEEPHGEHQCVCFDM